MEFHDVANLFPAMDASEYEALKADIAARGLLEPVWVHEGKVIDGRHRYKACVELGIEPRTQTWNGHGSLVEFVVSLNMRRRHLTASQKAVVALEIEAALAVEAKERQRLNAERLNAERWDSERSSFSNLRKTTSDEPIHAARQAAQIVGVANGYISDAKRLQRDNPALLDKVRSGELSLQEAKSEVKKQKHTERIEAVKQDIAQQKYNPPQGLYDVIVIDPPWAYGGDYDPNGHRVANPYPEMSLEEIAAINLPSSENCVLWLWTTHKYMRHAFELLDVWGFRDVAIVTWVKDRMGVGSWLRSQSEFCVMAVKGSPLINLVNQTTVIYGAMREHSRKPDEFYSLVDSLCVGYKLDWFARQARDGWSVFGAEQEKFNE